MATIRRIPTPTHCHNQEPHDHDDRADQAKKLWQPCPLEHPLQESNDDRSDQQLRQMREMLFDR